MHSFSLRWRSYTDFILCRVEVFLFFSVSFAHSLQLHPYTCVQISRQYSYSNVVRNSKLFVVSERQTDRTSSRFFREIRRKIKFMFKLTAIRSAPPSLCEYIGWQKRMNLNDWEPWRLREITQCQRLRRRLSSGKTRWMSVDEIPLKTNTRRRRVEPHRTPVPFVSETFSTNIVATCVQVLVAATVHYIHL